MRGNANLAQIFDIARKLDPNMSPNVQLLPHSVPSALLDLGGHGNPCSHHLLHLGGMASYAPWHVLFLNVGFGQPSLIVGGRAYILSPAISKLAVGHIISQGGNGLRPGSARI